MPELPLAQSIPEPGMAQSIPDAGLAQSMPEAGETAMSPLSESAKAAAASIVYVFFTTSIVPANRGLRLGMRSRFDHHMSEWVTVHVPPVGGPPTGGVTMSKRARKRRDRKKKAANHGKKPNA